MKTILVALLLLGSLALGFAQGSLTPPGPPAPMMKSLDQIEARTPISSAPFAITNPGSYYLTTNLSVSLGDAITINTDPVSLNLNGFTISSTRPTATVDAAIRIGNGVTDVTIRNGHIKSGVTNNAAGVYNGGGFAYGILAALQNYNLCVSEVSVVGCLVHGIYLGNNTSTLVDSCTVRTAGNFGIEAQNVSHSAAYNCGQYGILAGTGTDCYGHSVGSGWGIYGINLNQCYGYNTATGIGLQASTAIGCYGYSVGGTGLSAYIANSCEGVSSSGTNQVISFKYNMP